MTKVDIKLSKNQMIDIGNFINKYVPYIEDIKLTLYENDNHDCRVLIKGDTAHGLFFAITLMNKKTNSSNSSNIYMTNFEDLLKIYNINLLGLDIYFKISLKYMTKANYKDFFYSYGSLLANSLYPDEIVFNLFKYNDFHNEQELIQALMVLLHSEYNHIVYDDMNIEYKEFITKKMNYFGYDINMYEELKEDSYNKSTFDYLILLSLSLIYNKLDINLYIDKSSEFFKKFLGN